MSTNSHHHSLVGIPNAVTQNILPPTPWRQQPFSALASNDPSLFRFRLRFTCFLQCGETFGFDGLARFLLLGAHNVGLL